MRHLNRCQFWWAVLLASAAVFGRCNSGGIKWLGLFRQKPALEGRLQSEEFCRRLRLSGELNQKQYKFCRKFAVDKSDPGTISALIKSAQKTVAVCQQQFRHFRWNCNVLKHMPDLAPELKTLTAEQALVHALSGLILAGTFAEECSRGLVRRCGCGAEPTWLARERPEWQFKFEGCHTNLRMGQRLARKFLSSGRKLGSKAGGDGDGTRTIRGRQRGVGGRRPGGGTRGVFQKFVKMVNSYNYNVGIEAASRSEAVRCKCHGSSASCTLRTCHKVLHSETYQQLETTYFRRSDKDPMDLLLEMYDKKLRKTVFVETGYQGYEEPCTLEDRSSNPLHAEPKCETFKTVTGMPKDDVLLFHEHSLDYCNMREGKFPGTRGRECLPDGTPAAQKILQSEAVGQKRREIICSVMCCGRTYRNVTETFEGTHRECQSKTCRLLPNPFRVECSPCQLHKSYCN